MKTLKGNIINLRPLEPEDLQFLFDTENNELFWNVSHTQTPFSKFLLKQYIENSHLDIFEAKQLRLVIEDKTSMRPIGLIDLFDFNPQHFRAGIGILVHEKYQNKGVASEAIKLLVRYSFTHLNIHQLYANISSENKKSLALFKKHMFKKVGIKKDWIFLNNRFHDELLFQRIRKTNE